MIDSDDFGTMIDGKLTVKQNWLHSSTTNHLFTEFHSG